MTREDVLQEYGTHPGEPRSFIDCGAMADEILRLRHDARGVQAVEEWMRQNMLHLVGVVDESDNRLCAMRDAMGEPDTDSESDSLAALGHALLDQGRVTIQEEGEG